MRIVLLALVLLGGCATRPDPPAIQHVVIAWLKEPDNPDHRQTVIDESRRLAAIPGIRSVSAGRVVASDRPVVDDSFDIALVITFRDQQALADYVDHPLHQEVLRETLRPLVARYRVYDFAE